MGIFSTLVKLTERTAAAARPAMVKGEPRARLYLDTQQRGFGLAVSAKGNKSYFVLRRVAGKPVRYVFGQFGELTVAQRRAEAVQLLAQMSSGLNPQERRRKAREDAKREVVRGITLGQALTLYESTLRAKGRAERTIEDYRYLLEKYLGAWMDRPLAEITRADTRQRHAEIAREIATGKHSKRKRRGSSGTLTANHALRAFRAVYNRALREHPELPVNPVVNVDWNKENRRTTVIAAADLKDWHARVRALSNSVRRDYLLFTLFSGLRKENAAEAQWAHFDRKRGVLHIPAPKSQKPFDLPLSDFLIQLLETRQKENALLFSASPWVFPAARGAGHIVEVRMQGGSDRTHDGVEGTRYKTHDLRRTFITVAESLGISRESRQLLVNHSTPRSDVHGGYVVPELEQLRGHMQAIANRLLALCKPRTATTVVPLRRKATKGTR